MSNKKTPDRYRPENQIWTQIDQKRTCKLSAVICPKCFEELGKECLGHKDIYLNSSKQTKRKIGADIVVKHCHFTMDMDQGRNVWCVIDRIMISKKYLKMKFVLNDNALPYWIKEKLE